MAAEPPPPAEAWASGGAYEPYIGRWSRLVAWSFLHWLAVRPGGRWLDVGCGTGALSQTILELSAPAQVTGLDASEAYLTYARQQVPDARVQFRTGDAQALAVPDGEYDATVSGLVLNFVPEPARVVAEMARVTHGGGIVAVYVWDYAGQMQLIRQFWDAAVALDPAARGLDEGVRFPLCHPDRLTALFENAKLGAVASRAIDVPTVFRNFDDYWSPFLGGQGPAPGYAMGLSEEHRAALRDQLRVRLPSQPDGSIPLIARAWAVRGSPSRR